MDFQHESFAAIRQEAQHLAAAHWDETEAPMYGAKRYTLDAEHYARMQDADILRIFTAREAGLLVGYAAFFVLWNTHLGGKAGLLDGLFVHKAHRGHTGMALLRHAQAALLEQGTVAVQYVSPASRDCGALYRRLGARLTETIYTRMC